MTAMIKPDADLGVTVLVITSATSEHALDEVVAQVAAACFVEELQSSVGQLVHHDDRSGGAS